VIPTYNEAENIARLIAELRALALSGLDILVVDDGSPDGTADLVEEMSKGDPQVFLHRRSGPPGRGLAGRDGFLYALEKGYGRAVEMDADFSHQPKHVPALLAALGECDLAVGSRKVAGGSDLDRPWPRRVLTWAANAYARLLLGVPVKDANSGFRCFSARALQAVEPSTLKSRGPAIIHEVLFRVCRAGLKVKEVPIEFVDRKRGDSKLDLGRLAAGYLAVLKMALWPSLCEACIKEKNLPQK
jgi:dolichol-phosphate mannosyltransferase